MPKTVATNTQTDVRNEQTIKTKELNYFEHCRPSIHNQNQEPKEL